MSIDWDKRQSALGKHKHLASDILAEETGEVVSSSVSSSLISFPVPFDTPGLDDGIVAFTIPDGSWLIDVWVTLTTLWDGAGSYDFNVGHSGDVAAFLIFDAKSPAADPLLDWPYGGFLAPGNPFNDTQLVASQFGAYSGNPRRVPLLAVANADVYVRVPDASATAGRADIYAIIATLS